VGCGEVEASAPCSGQVDESATDDSACGRRSNRVTRRHVRPSTLRAPQGRGRPPTHRRHQRPFTNGDIVRSRSALRPCQLLRQPAGQPNPLSGKGRSQPITSVSPFGGPFARFDPAEMNNTYQPRGWTQTRPGSGRAGRTRAGRHASKRRLGSRLLVLRFNTRLSNEPDQAGWFRSMSRSHQGHQQTRGHHLGKPKTPKSRRTVTVSSEVATVLRRLVEGRAADDFIFVTPTGLPLHNADFYERVWTPLMRKARRRRCPPAPHPSQTRP
jgi:hypothetical protein